MTSQALERRASDHFVGRERELAELSGALAEAPAGRGRTFLISGEPGIGKTRLMNEVSRFAAERGIRTVWGRCWEGEGAPAYWPWIQVIRSLVASLNPADRESVLESEAAAPMVQTIARIVPDLLAAAPRAIRPPQAGADSAQTQFRLFDSVAGLLREIARQGPIAILLDDLHDADTASLTMLRFVARESTGVGILIIGTYRDQEVQRAPVLSQLIGDLGREARSLPLAGLSPDEIAQLYDEVVGRPADAATVEKLHQATAGNPLFVDGIVRGLIAQRDQGHDIAALESLSAPHTIREAIARRLRKLSDDARAALEVAA
ncbi:MAG TPA: AAA family ATPase, partial [Candidatus Binataceae bacterium]|nr:AAA family ATPase [Candidatus Binataceae bacterium]